ncbi:hypothetical protein RYX36_009434 [Vicia faba]
MDIFTTNNSSCCSSDTSLQNSDGSHWMFVSNEEIRLAASTPKKRAGRKKFKETRHPVYRGVRRRNNNKWVCEMREPNKKTKIWLGTFPTVEMAARAHDVAAMALRGRYACLNFADSTWRLPKPVSSEAKDIQKAATEAAEAFRPEKILVTNEVEKISTTNDVDIETAVAASATVEQIMQCMVEEEDEDMSMPEMWRNMALMSPRHSFGYHDQEFQYIDEQDYQDQEISLWTF